MHLEIRLPTPAINRTEQQANTSPRLHTTETNRNTGVRSLPNIEIIEEFLVGLIVAI